MLGSLKRKIWESKLKKRNEVNIREYMLSIYFGFHDSCITISDKKEILLHLEAERIFRKKHIRLNKGQMIKLIKIGLDYININIEQVDKIYLAKWNNQFGEGIIEILGKIFNPIMTSHHENHIGACLDHKLKDAIIFCADGGSEDGSTKVYFKKQKKISLIDDLDSSPLTGKFYGTITQMIINPEFGRAHDTYPGKTMGLASTGNFDKKIYSLIDKNKKEINKLHINGCNHLLKKFNLTKDYSSPWLDKKRRDLAFNAQLYWENKFFEKVKKYRKYSKNLILVGGCAYNVLLNSKIVESSIFSRIIISPVSGDCGQSIGAILYHNPQIKCNYPFLGRSFGEIDLKEEIIESVVNDLLNHKIIAWFQGRSEIGPRALGHRSFLGLPDSISMRNKLSIKVKRREPYRPVASIIAEEFLQEFFETKNNSPYMNFSPKAKEITKKIAPAIVHYDNTSRIQTLSAQQNKVIYKILLRIMKETGAPILMNTSFNTNGEPIVDTPKDAFKSFQKSKADVLYLNGRRYGR